MGCCFSLTLPVYCRVQVASKLSHLFLVASDVNLGEERLGHWTHGCVFPNGFGKQVTNVVVNKRGRVCHTTQHPTAGSIRGGTGWW